jgi:uncharacterized protein
MLTSAWTGWKLTPKNRPRDQLGSWTRTLPRDNADNAIRGTRPSKKRQADYGKKMSYTARRLLLEKTRKFVQEYMSQPRFDGSHDYQHVLRVVALSMEILRVEQNTYRKIVFEGLIVELVALMHDIDDQKYRLHPSDETESYPSPPTTNEQAQPNLFDPFQPPTTSQRLPIPPNIDPNLESSTPPVPSVEGHLLRIGWPAAIASKVGAITPFISYTAETTNKAGFASALAFFPELAVVQDADRLDAIGATGIGRAFTYGGAKGKEGGMADTLKHAEEKLSKLEGMMKTPEGKRLSIVRAERLRTYGRWWLEEMRQVGMAGEGAMEWTEGVSPWATENTPEAEDGPGLAQEAAETATDPHQPSVGEASSSASAHANMNVERRASVANMLGTAGEGAIDDPGSQLMEAISTST